MSVLQKQQIVNAIETRLAQGYTNPEMIGELLMPRLPVAKRYGTYLTFGKEDFMVYDTKRGRGADAKRMNFEFNTATYAIPYTHALEAPIDDEEDDQTVGVNQLNLITQSRQIIQASLSVEREIEIAAIVADVASYGSNHGAVATGWTTTGTADILSDVLDARESIRSRTGVYPNTMAVSAKTHKSVQKNQKLVDLYKYTTGAKSVGYLTEDMLATIFGVDQYVVGKGVKSDSSGTFSDIWGTSFAALLYVGKPQGGGVIDPSRVPPSFGYTLQLNGYPKVVNYREERKNSLITQVKEGWLPLLTAVNGECGWFFEGTLGA
jgi:hypothetical protein